MDHFRYTNIELPTRNARGKKPISHQLKPEKSMGMMLIERESNAQLLKKFQGAVGVSGIPNPTQIP